MIYINIPIITLHQYVRYFEATQQLLFPLDLILICWCGIPNRKHTGFKSNSLLKKIKFSFATTVILYVHMSILCV